MVPSDYNSNCAEEDLEKVINPKGKKNLGFRLRGEIANRQDKTRNFLATLAIIVYLIITSILIFFYTSGVCGEKGSICDSPIYLMFNTLVSVIIGFYFGKK